MITRKPRRRPRVAVIGWLAAISFLVVGVVLIAARDASFSALQAVGTDDLAYQVVLGVSASSVGAFILLRRPGHGIGVICLAAGILAGLGLFGEGVVQLSARRQAPIELIPALGLVAAAAAPILAFALIGPILVGAYPSGRFGPIGRWITALAAAILVPLAILTTITQPTIEFDGLVAPNPLWVPALPLGRVDPQVMGGVAILGYVGGLALASLGLVMRYRTSDPLERLQIRLVAANGVAIVALIGLIIINPAGLGEAAWSFLLLISALVPISVGVAILRYRLYDIDRIVSNAIGYGLVSLVLVGAFAVVNLGLQGALLISITGSNPLAVAATTLLVAVLFNPLRSRVQRVVDRRFHRARYDAEQTVAGLAGRLRDEVDIDSLRLEILEVVDGSVNPTDVHLWLRRAPR